MKKETRTGKVQVPFPLYYIIALQDESKKDLEDHTLNVTELHTPERLSRRPFCRPLFDGEICPTPMYYGPNESFRRPFSEKENE